MRAPLIRDWTCTACGRSGTVVIAPRDTAVQARDRVRLSHTAQNPRRGRPNRCEHPHFTTSDRPPRAVTPASPR